jgi:hypothetical protein
MLQMGALSVSIGDHKERRWRAHGPDGVWCHGRELGCFAGIDDHPPLSNHQFEPSSQHEQPVVAGMEAWLGTLG